MDFMEEQIFYISIKKALVVLLISIFFLAIGVQLFLDGNIIGYLSAIFGGACTIIFSTLLLGMLNSYYLALEYFIDPSPVDIVEDFKDRMKG